MFWLFQKPQKTGGSLERIRVYGRLEGWLFHI